MYKLIFLLALILPLNIAFADDVQQTITLKDGSQIKGTLSGIENGVYTVKTPIIGDVHVAATDVASITNGNAAPPAPVANTAAAIPPTSGATNLDQQIASTQQKLMSDPQSMQMIMQMEQNPEIMEALKDPALVQAITSHDLQAVQSNPAIQKLINDPQMKALVEKMAAEQQQASH